jgi:hypothetical protein
MADSLCEVLRIRRTRVAHLGGEHYSMSRPLQLSYYTPVGEIIVDVEFHAPDTPSVGTQGGLSRPRLPMSVKTSWRSCCSMSAWCRQ